MKTKEQVIGSLKKALEELDITSSLRLPIIQTIEYLQEEPVSEDLEEAANDAVISLVPSFGQKYSDGSYVSSCIDCFNREELLELFKAGVEWQKQKDSIHVSDDLESFVRNYREKYWYPDDIDKFIGFAKQVANWQKQLLMAKAVDATVHIDAGGYPYIPQMELYDYEKDIPLAKEGDKYKVILIKELL